MKINRYRKIFVISIISIIIFFKVIMMTGNVYGYYSDNFKKFLVLKYFTTTSTTSDGTKKITSITVPVEGKTKATIDNKTYEIPFALDVNKITKYVQENCVDKKGNIDNSLVSSNFDQIAYSLIDSEEAKGSLENKYYNNLAQIIGRLKVVIMNKKASESIVDAINRDKITYEITGNTENTENKDNTENKALTKEELMAYDYSKIKEYLNNGDNIYWGGSKGNEKKIKGIDDNSDFSESDREEIKKKWAEVVAKETGNDKVDANIEDYLKKEIEEEKKSTYYKSLNVSTSSSSSGLDDVISDGDSFINVADKNDILKISNLQKFTRDIYNILLTIGVAVAVITGAIIGIKYMLGSVEEKADIKGLLIPYIAGCVIVFGAFAIWKLVVTLLQGI